MQYTGQINLILGPMYSGKTTELLRLFRRYYLAGKQCLLVKHKDDNRYDSEYIVTHDNQKYKAINTKYLKDIIENKNVLKSEVLCIDEIQFYEDASEICDLWANNGKIVIASGLNGDFKREPFEQISKLEENKYNLKGIYYQQFPERYFPSKIRASHILGYVKEVDRSIQRSSQVNFLLTIITIAIDRAFESI